MYIKGEQVEVIGMNNKKATLRVWADKGHGLLLCTDKGYHLGTITGEEPMAVGFPLSDIKRRVDVSQA